MPWALLGLAIASLVAFNILFVLVIGAAANRQQEGGHADPEIGYQATEDDIPA